MTHSETPARKSSASACQFDEVPGFFLEIRQQPTLFLRYQNWREQIPKLRVVFDEIILFQSQPAAVC